MTKAEILQATRYLVNELSTDVGAGLDDAGNLLGFIDDGVEQVVMDLIGIYPNELLEHEDISMKANVKLYEVATEFWQVLKICKTVAGETETEMDIIDPLSQQYAETHDETNDKPFAANIINGILYVFPTPASDITNYIRVWGVQAETITMSENGPMFIPRPAHRLICFWAAYLVATMFGATRSAQAFMLLYQNRLEKIRLMQKGKFQQAPRFVRESVVERTIRDTREPAFYDTEWN
jgi:hypothetical protein